MRFISQKMSKRVIVIGGGPAGMMAAGTAAALGCKVTLIEKNRILGKKLLITGKGRCNVTNFCDNDNVIKNITSSNPKFMYSAFSEFSCYDTYAFFEERGVPLKIERGNRVFPQSDRAADIRNALSEYMKSYGVKVVQGKVISVHADPLGVKTADSVFEADSIIIATGGISYPLTGSTGDGYIFAGGLSHGIVRPKPALVPLLCSGNLCRSLAGLSLKNVGVTFNNERNETVFSDFGEMLFTHTGISGPIILTASSKLNPEKEKYKAYIDLKPALSEKELDARVLRDFNKYINKDFVNSLEDLLPRKIIPAIIEKSGINPRQKVNTITKDQRRLLVDKIKAFDIPVSGKAGFDEAIVTAGGVDTSEINPKTMESTKVKGIYFAGEVMDVSANTGGYNLQIAFSSGYLAGKACAGGKDGI